MTEPIEQACFWLARRAPRGWAELSGAHEADVGIVGAGLTGLWTALFLKRLEPGLEVAAVRAEVHSPLYLGGVRVTGGGVLDPVKLVDGLRAEAARLGVQVWERSPAVAVEPAGAGVRIRTARGGVSARRVVLATSA